jgi:hypothetical protein
MPVNKRAFVSAPSKTVHHKTYRSGTHPVGSAPRPDPRAEPPDPRAEPTDPRAEPTDPPRPRQPRHGLSALLVRSEPPAATSGRDAVGAMPDIEIADTEDEDCEPEVRLQATVDAVCDGCGTVVEVELSRFLESSAVACADCLDAVVKGWGKALDRPTIEWIPSTALLTASRPPVKKP